jgi:hypothetical protein
MLPVDALLRRGKSSTTLVKLMMACNDLTLANDALGMWKKEDGRQRLSRQRGAQMYFVRLQIGHLVEALKIVEEFRKDPELMRLLQRCDARTRASFAHLEPFLKGGVREREFTGLAGQLRHNLAFHYNESGKLIERALARRGTRFPGKPSVVTRGTPPILSYFSLADELLDSIVVRQLWGIPEDADLRNAADDAIMRVHEVLLAFVDFAGEVCWKLTER